MDVVAKKHVFFFIFTPLCHRNWWHRVLKLCKKTTFYSLQANFHWNLRSGCELCWFGMTKRGQWHARRLKLMSEYQGCHKAHWAWCLAGNSWCLRAHLGQLNAEQYVTGSTHMVDRRWLWPTLMWVSHHNLLTVDRATRPPWSTISFTEGNELGSKD